MRQTPIRLLIWDNQKHRADALREKLSSGVDYADVLTGTAFKGDELEGYNVLLMSDERHKTRLISSIVEVAHRCNVRVIMFSDMPLIANVVRCMASGADSYLTFPISRKDLVIALDDISARLEVHGSKAMNSLSFSGRETELLQMLASDMSVLESAKLLGLSPHTVKSHRRSMRRKMIGWMNVERDD